MSIWTLCHGHEYIRPLSIDPWRVVEAQHILSTRDLVDSQEEHFLLETLIEESKPVIDKDKNYLLFTPFRYPPLKHGSRFGKTTEPSLWYGSLELETAFTEVAYYRLKFFADTNANLGYVDISMTAFRTHISTDSGIDLTHAPFDDHTDKISDKNTYEYSQELGSHMRKDGVQAFMYYSARTPKNAKNIAALTPDVFKRQNNHYVHHQQNFRCLANKEVIEFTRIDILGRKFFSFSNNVNIIFS